MQVLVYTDGLSTTASALAFSSLTRRRFFFFSPQTHSFFSVMYGLYFTVFSLYFKIQNSVPERLQINKLI